MKYDLLAMSGHKGKAAFEEIKNKDSIRNRRFLKSNCLESVGPFGYRALLGRLPGLNM